VHTITTVNPWSEPQQPNQPVWVQLLPDFTHRLYVRLIAEKEGGFSAIARNLPGVASQGETEAEALANVKEAALGCIEQYKADGKEIPWIEWELVSPVDRTVVVNLFTE